MTTLDWSADPDLHVAQENQNGFPADLQSG